ncbi:hypothetical protein B0H14DRAFT_2649392 [Mycena olivaceomarginata]|nr:hypothetical protein B0H14DRAFT_2649392 [Mycena olivaceomarginata]
MYQEFVMEESTQGSIENIHPIHQSYRLKYTNEDTFLAHPNISSKSRIDEPPKGGAPVYSPAHTQGVGAGSRRRVHIQSERAVGERLIWVQRGGAIRGCDGGLQEDVRSEMACAKRSWEMQKAKERCAIRWRTACKREGGDACEQLAIVLRVVSKRRVAAGGIIGGGQSRQAGAAETRASDQDGKGAAGRNEMQAACIGTQAGEVRAGKQEGWRHGASSQDGKCTAGRSEMQAKCGVRRLAHGCEGCTRARAAGERRGGESAGVVQRARMQRAGVQVQRARARGPTGAVSPKGWPARRRAVYVPGYGYKKYGRGRRARGGPEKQARSRGATIGKPRWRVF